MWFAPPAEEHAREIELGVLALVGDLDVVADDAAARRHLEWPVVGARAEAGKQRREMQRRHRARDQLDVGDLGIVADVIVVTVLACPASAAPASATWTSTIVTARALAELRRSCASPSRLRSAAVRTNTRTTGLSSALRPSSTRSVSAVGHEGGVERHHCGHLRLAFGKSDQPAGYPQPASRTAA